MSEGIFKEDGYPKNCPMSPSRPCFFQSECIVQRKMFSCKYSPDYDEGKTRRAHSSD